jgi:excisionase family DNA binding protein
MSPELLTPDEVAAELRLSRSAVYALCEAGKLRHLRAGVNRGRIRIPRRALAEYLNQAEAAPPVIEPRRTRTAPVRGADFLRSLGWKG